MQTKKIFKTIAISLTILLLALSVNVYAEPEEAVDASESTDVSTGTSLIATSEEKQENLITPKPQKDGDLYLMDNKVVIDYPVHGNVFVMAQSVTIDNEIDGNVFVMAESISTTEKAYIYQDMFAMANNIKLKGYIYDVYAIGQSISVESVITRDLHVGCSKFYLQGAIGRNVDLSANNIEIFPSSAIGGNLNYTSSNEVEISEGVVSGKTNYTKSTIEAEVKEEANPVGSMIAKYIKDLIKTLLYGLAIIAFVVFLMKKFTIKSSEIISNKLLPATGYGALTLIAVPFAALILLITGIGLPVSLLLMAAYIFMLTVTTPILSLAIAKIICDKKNIEKKGMLILFSMLFVLAFWAVKNLPVIGGLASLATSILGSGIIIYAVFHINKDLTVKEEKTKTESKKQTK